MLIRLVGAVLAEQHDEWTEGRRYLGIDIMNRSRLTGQVPPTADTSSMNIDDRMRAATEAGFLLLSQDDGQQTYGRDDLTF